MRVIGIGFLIIWATFSAPVPLRAAGVAALECIYPTIEGLEAANAAAIREILDHLDAAIILDSFGGQFSSALLTVTRRLEVDLALSGPVMTWMMRCATERAGLGFRDFTGLNRAERARVLRVFAYEVADPLSVLAAANQPWYSLSGDDAVIRFRTDTTPKVYFTSELPISKPRFSAWLEARLVDHPFED